MAAAVMVEGAVGKSRGTTPKRRKTLTTALGARAGTRTTPRGAAAPRERERRRTAAAASRRAVALKLRLLQNGTDLYCVCFPGVRAAEVAGGWRRLAVVIATTARGESDEGGTRAVPAPPASNRRPGPTEAPPAGGRWSSTSSEQLQRRPLRRSMQRCTATCPASAVPVRRRVSRVRAGGVRGGVAPAPPVPVAPTTSETPLRTRASPPQAGSQMRMTSARRYPAAAMSPSPALLRLRPARPLRVRPRLPHAPSPWSPTNHDDTLPALRTKQRRLNRCRNAATRTAQGRRSARGMGTTRRTPIAAAPHPMCPHGGMNSRRFPCRKTGVA